jgi:restriction system protein
MFLPPIPILDVLTYAFSFVFMCWPVIIISPLQRRRHILANMLLAWGLLVVVRVFLLFAPSRMPLFFIPEPLNTILFFVAGAVLLTIRLGITFWQNKKFQQKADGANDTEDLLRLSPSEYEQMVVELYQAYGHQAKRTGAIGDHGVDVTVQTKSGEKWIVQCKRWRGTVGEPVVRDFYGVMQHEKADKGAIITAGKFTLQAREWAKGKPIYLYDGPKFLDAWKRAKAEKQNNQATA